MKEADLPANAARPTNMKLKVGAFPWTVDFGLAAAKETWWPWAAKYTDPPVDTPRQVPATLDLAARPKAVGTGLAAAET